MPLHWEYNFRNYTTDNGLPSSETYDIEQDNDGNIWIATDRGLVKYDGYSFVTYTKKDGLVNNTILQIYKDPFGRLWFLSIVNDLCYYEKGRIKKYKYNDKINAYLKSPLMEKNMLILPNKSLVISLVTSGSIIINSKGKVKKISQEELTFHFFSFGGKEVWSYLAPHYYKYNAKGLFHRVYYPHKIGDKQKLIFKQKLNGPRIRYVKIHDTPILLINNNVINLQSKKQILESREPIIYIGNINNKFWTGTLNKGAAIYKWVDGKPILIKSFLNGYSVSNVLQDKNGGYWFSTLEGGVFYLCTPEIEVINKKNGLISNKIRSIEGCNNSIYLGFSAVGIQKLTSSTIETIDYEGNNTILGSIGNKLIVSDYSGLHCEGKLIHFNAQRDLYCQNDKCFYVNFSAQSVNKTGEREIFYEDYSLSKKMFQAIMQDGKKHIWLGGKEGLFAVKNKKLVPYFPEKFPPMISDLLYTPKWGKIASTKEDGLYLFDHSGFHKINGLLTDNISCLFTDRKGKLWVGTSKGINILTKTKTGEIEIDCLTKDNGLCSNEITAIHVDDKYAWIGTNKGLSKVNFTILDRKKTKYSVFLHSISLKSHDLDISRALQIPYSEDIIKINFGTVNFITKGYYKYRLNSQQQWTYLRKPQIVLLNPEDGNYDLEISFRNENNQWSKVQNIASFEITPPFWRTSYFKLFIVLVIAYLIFLFVRYKKRQFETKQKLLILEQKALFAQMNPHFIFNTLNSIQSFLIYNENDKAEYYLSKFSKLLRQTLHISRNSTVTLGKEIDLLEKYLELEQMRFSNKFSWEFKTNIFDDNLEVRIPNMLIQPYIENSIKHGFIEKREDYKIEIILTQLNEHSIKCEIIDNGIGRKVSLQKKENIKSLKEHVSYGEKITKERLKSYNKSRSNIYGSKVQDLAKGTKVELIVPIITE